MKNYNKIFKILLIILIMTIIVNVGIRRNEYLLEDGLYEFKKEIKLENHNSNEDLFVYAEIKENKISSINSREISAFGEGFVGTIDLNLTSDFNIIYYIEGEIYEKDPYLDSQPTEILITENNRQIIKYELPEETSLSFYDSISEIGTISREDLIVEEVFNPILTFSNMLIGFISGYLLFAALFYRSYKNGDIYGKYRLKTFTILILAIFIVNLLWNFINKSQSNMLFEFIKIIVLGIITIFIADYKYEKTKINGILEKSFMGIGLVLTIVALISSGKYLSEAGFNRYGKSSLSETMEQYDQEALIENYGLSKYSYKPGYPDNLANIVEIKMFNQNDRVYEYPELILIKDSPISLLPLESYDLNIGDEVKITFGKLKTEKPEFNKRLITWVLRNGKYLYKYETNEKVGELELKIEEKGDYAFLFMNEGEETLTLESGKIEINKSGKSARFIESRFNL